MNGYAYNGGYGGGAMEQGEPSSGDDMMMMGSQDGMTGMVGGQSLDDIVNANAKAMRRQSMPNPYADAANNMGADIRRMSMMEYAGASGAGPLASFKFDPNAGMTQGGMMPGPVTPQQH